MRIKTSLYIDEGVDLRIDERMRARNVSKSKVMTSDIERFFLCIDAGRRACDASINRDVRAQIVSACADISGETAKATFILTGEINAIKDRSLKQFCRALSVIERLALIDEAEETQH